MRFPAVGPVPAERPLMLDGLGTSSDQPSNAVAETGGAPSSARGRRSRIAKAQSTDRAPGVEAPAATPAETRMADGDGQREAAAPTIGDLIARHAMENGVPVSLAQAVVRIESRFNTHASNRGALGLMQIKPGTARAAGFNGGAAGLFVADTNLHFGMKILGQAFRSSGGDICRALVLYQSGHLATRITRSNRSYCKRARAVMAGA